MNNANLYSDLLDILKQDRTVPTGCIFGTLSGVDPLAVRVGGRTITQGLCYPAEKVFRAEQIGRNFALLPCENGLLILFEVEEAT